MLKTVVLEWITSGTQFAIITVPSGQDVDKFVSDYLGTMRDLIQIRATW